MSLDREGVGELIRIATERGRKARNGLKLGICGEHGGDPASVAFCHEIGLDYVSCSPFRVPIARLAAAQAALGKGAASTASGTPPVLRNVSTSPRRLPSALSTAPDVSSTVSADWRVSTAAPAT